MKLIIPRPQELEKLKSQIKRDGYENLHVLADFDRTLTYGMVNGIKTPSLLAMLRDGNHLTPDYAAKANALFNRYHPLEADPDLSINKKKKAMQEWWETHEKLFIKSGLSKNDFKELANNKLLKFREGADKFFELLYKNKIPLVIFSASGCGDAIPIFFKNHSYNYRNIFYVTNKFNWDENGKALSFKRPIIHSMNKDETILSELPEIYSKIKNRKNVILLGDTLGDLGMITGFDYNSLIKICFSNSDDKKLRKEYEKNFDIVCSGEDGNFNFINSLLKDLKK